MVNVIKLKMSKIAKLCPNIEGAMKHEGNTTIILTARLEIQGSVETIQPLQHS